MKIPPFIRLNLWKNPKRTDLLDREAHTFLAESNDPIGAFFSIPARKKEKKFGCNLDVTENYGCRQLCNGNTGLDQISKRDSRL